MRSDRLNLFYKLLFLFVVGFIVFLVLDYGKCWQSFDYSLGYYPRALLTGAELTSRDFVRIFDFGKQGFHFGGPQRIRYLQDLFLLLDIKFRIWLFNYLPPHPSLSLAWLFVLILSPLLMYKLMYNVTLSRRAAWIGLILFGLSTGSLSGITLLCNPAKTLASFFALLCFFLASRIELRSPGEDISSRYIRIAVLLLPVMFLSFLTDETAWFICIFIPILFPSLFGSGKRGFTAAVLFILVSIVFVLAMLFILPAILNYFDTGTEYPVSPGSLIRDYMQDPDRPSTRTMLKLFSGRYALSSAANLVCNQLIPWNTPWLGAVYAFILPFLVHLFIRLDRDKKWLVARGIIVLAAFILLQSYGFLAVLWEEGFVIPYSYYYGNLLSIFITIPIAILLASPMTRTSGLISKMVLLWLIFTSAYNFIRINEDVRKSFAAFEKTGELDYAFALRAWRARFNQEKIEEIKLRFPVRSPWVYIQELEVIAAQQSQEPSARCVPLRAGNGTDGT